MKRFFYNLFGLSVLFLAFFICFLLLSAQNNLRMPIAELTDSSDYAYEDFGAKEIIPFVERAQKKSEHSKLIIGDSVCHQIFDRYYDSNNEYCICGSNQAISLSGQYIIAKEFIENHDNVTDVYLVLTMSSLATEYGAQLGYQYAVMPFVLTDTIDNLDETTIKEMYRTYGGFFCQKPIVRLIDQSPLCMKLYLNMLAKEKEWFPTGTGKAISDVSGKYLYEIQMLCEKENVTLHLIAGPHADSENNHKTENRIRDELLVNEKNKVLENYLNQITYYPENLFKDGIHFDKSVVDEVFFDSISQELIPDFKRYSEGF